MSWQGGGVALSPATATATAAAAGTLVEVLATVQEDKPTNRFNDGKCDSSGRFWCGTMAVESSPGNLPRNEGFLYCYSEGHTAPP